jgi:hypothetical protein
MKQPDLFNAQLFIDDRWIEDSSFVTRTWGQLCKHPEPVLTAQHPWERWCPVLYGTVLFWRGLFRMWYCTWSRASKPVACYAQSEDGVVWEKPALGIYEWNGDKTNNICLRSAHPNGKIDNLSVIADEDDEEWPLKMLYWDSHDRKRDPSSPWGIYAARSSDGVHWDASPGLVLPQWGDRFNAAPCRVDGKYLLMGRVPQTTSAGIAQASGDKGRTVYRVESENLMDWSTPHQVLSADHEDPCAMQVYSATVIPYEGRLLGSIERMHVSPDKLDTELIWSNDAGYHWQRTRTRAPFLSWGSTGHWDDHWVNLSTNAPIHRHGRLWFYYSGRSGAHAAPYPSNRGAIGLAFLRRDGFASLYAGERYGYVVTPCMNWPAAELYVNCDPRRDVSAHPGFISGSLAVEVRDENHHPVDGFRFDDCEEVRVNTASYPDAAVPVKWRNDNSLRALCGKNIRLVFRLRDCHLYSFRAADIRS